MHGGEIKAFNNRHAGCSFRILLPLQREEGKDEKTIIIDHNDSSAIPVQDSGSPKEKEALSMLVVEDNADMRDISGLFFVNSIMYWKLPMAKKHYIYLIVIQ